MKTEVASYLLKKYGKKNPPEVKSGDTIRVHQRIKEGDKERVQIFEGLVIATKHGTGLDGSFTVRKIAVGGIGVERTYPLHSPNILKVERLKTAKVSRTKLYYMRDLRGKSARFKLETRTPMVWAERNAEAVIEEIEEQVAEAAEEAAAEKAELEEEAAAEEAKEESKEEVVAEKEEMKEEEAPKEEKSDKKE